MRAQRECRLRPHYSDPMPADASKRKQLEMKIAAAARLHGHRRDRDRDSGKRVTLSPVFSLNLQICVQTNCPKCVVLGPTGFLSCKNDDYI